MRNGVSNSAHDTYQVRLARVSGPAAIKLSQADLRTATEYARSLAQACAPLHVVRECDNVVVLVCWGWSS